MPASHNNTEGLEDSQVPLFQESKVMIWDCPITGKLPVDWVCPVTVL